MRKYRSLTNPDGSTHSAKQHVNPYYGKRGADWVQNSNASLFSANHERTQNNGWRHVETWFSRSVKIAIWVLIGAVVMVVVGFIIYALALGL